MNIPAGSNWLKTETGGAELLCLVPGPVRIADLQRRCSAGKSGKAMLHHQQMPPSLAHTAQGYSGLGLALPATCERTDNEFLSSRPLCRQKTFFQNGHHHHPYHQHNLHPSFIRCVDGPHRIDGQQTPVYLPASIPVTKIAEAFGKMICSVFLAAYVITGCYTMSSFFKLGKRIAYTILLKH